MKVDNNGYVCRKISFKPAKYVSWFLGKPLVSVQKFLLLPEKYHGKRIRLKVEIVEDLKE